MKIQLQQDRLPTNLMRPSLVRPLYRSLRVAASVSEVESDSEVSILLTDDSRINELNLAYRGFDKPTDVLSFPQDDPFLLGDVAISLDTAARQAKAASWILSFELALLGVHGFLHLLGYDDEDLEGAQLMETLSRKILTAAGVSLPTTDHPFFRSFQEEA